MSSLQNFLTIARFRCTIRILFRLSLTLSVAGPVSASAADATATNPGTVSQHHRPTTLRFFEPEVWGTKSVELSNPSANPLEVVTGGYFDGSPLARYARRVTLPSESIRVVTFPVLPTATENRTINWHPLLYSSGDKTGTLLRASDNYMIDSELLSQPSEKITAVIADMDKSDIEQLQTFTELASVTGILLGQTRRLVEMDAGDVPVDANGLDVVDRIILGSNRIADDPARLACLRSWVEQGGLLWVRLDHVDVSTVHHLFGERVGLQFVDRSSLSTFQIYNRNTGKLTGELQQFDYPVELVRVLTDAVEIIHEVNGWPVSFITAIGKGRVVFTTLGDRAWIRDRTNEDQPAATEFYSDFLAAQSLVELTDQWTQLTDPLPLDASDFEPLLAAQVGYRIPGKGTILSVLGLFCVVLAGIGCWFHRAHQTDAQEKHSGRSILTGRRLEHLAVIGPVLGVLAAVPIVIVSQVSRSSIPASMSLAEFVEVMPSTSTLQSIGAVAIFTPDVESVDLTVSHGRILIPPKKRLMGTLQEMARIDFGKTQWRDLNLNAGLQFFTTRQTRPIEQPVSVTVSFGPDGVEGTFGPGSFSDPEDVVIASQSLNVLAVNMNKSHQFNGSIDTTLAPGVYVRGTLLTDQQVQRQDVYRSLLAAKTTSRYPRKPVLLAWMRPANPNLNCPDDFDPMNHSLVAVPVRYRVTPPGTDVIIPSTFLTFEAATTDNGGRTTVYNNRTGMWSEGFQHTQTLLRFSIPNAVKPLTLNRVNLEFKLLAPSRAVVFTVGRRGNPANVALVDDAAGTYKFSLTDFDQLQLDPDGSYYVGVGVQPSKYGGTGAASGKAWKMDFLRLEMFGRTAETVPQTTAKEETTEE